MGNWRTVNIKGSVSPKEARQMICCLISKFGEHYCPHEVQCLAISQGGAGLWCWIDEKTGKIDAVGNLYERDFTNDDIECALTYLADKFHSLDITLHSGDNYESLKCTATFMVKDGKCIRSKPQIKQLEAITDETINEGLELYKKYVMTKSIELRCDDCMFLVTDENGYKVCDECGKNIYDILLGEECGMNTVYS